MFAVTKKERTEHQLAVNARTEEFQHIEVFDILTPEQEQRDSPVLGM